jgi:hypothetical protein
MLQTVSSYESQGHAKTNKGLRDELSPNPQSIRFLEVIKEVKIIRTLCKPYRGLNFSDPDKKLDWMTSEGRSCRLVRFESGAIHATYCFRILHEGLPDESGTSIHSHY